MGSNGSAPVRRARILAPEVIIRREPGGTIYARSPRGLGPYPPRLTSRLDHWAYHTPRRVFLAQRDAQGRWRSITYDETWQRVRRIARSLVDRRLTTDRPILILSGNSLEHALLALAAMYCGVPYAPVAPAYSLLAREHTTLQALTRLMRPGLVFAADGREFEQALESVRVAGTELVTVTPSDALTTTPFRELEDRDATSVVDDAHARVGAATIAKILFTSGSTGNPKGVINTQQMLCANQEQIKTAMPLLADAPLVLCDWLPWNHTFGGNHNFGIVLYNGGTLYVDEGKPTPGSFDTTVANLREIATTAYFNVPKGFEMLAPVLESDAGFRRHFFSRLQMLFYAAAGLRQDVADHFERLAVDACGERIPWVTGLGATETAPFAICTGARMSTTANVGVPVPGIELKLVPAGRSMEARLRGPNVTPGYWKNDALTRAAFDEEGFYRTGDAVDFADPHNPFGGLVFQGRLEEDFKLSTGTWVRVGPLRAAFIAHLEGLVDDVVIAAPNRDFVAALMFPNLAACRRLTGEGGSAAPRQVLEDPAVIGQLRLKLERFAATHPGSSTCVAAAAILEDAPSLDASEITAKGSLNQKALLQTRKHIVEQLYGAPGTALVLRLSEGSTSA
jgi:feruloyl-CoA synthase